VAILAHDLSRLTATRVGIMVATRQVWWPIGTMHGFSHYEIHNILLTVPFPPEHPKRNPRVHMYYIKGGFVILASSPVLNGVSSFGIA
jgi:hypothetical protein